MKFNKGIVKNFNKRLLAGAIALTFAATPLVGCSDVSINDIEYTTNDQGYVRKIEDTVSYNVLEYCSFYTVYNNKTNEKYYTIGLKDEWNGTYFIKYYDIFTKQELVYSDYAFHSIDSVKDYLTEQNNIKKQYTLEDLKQILSQFVDEYEKSNEKTLVKKW